MRWLFQDVAQPISAILPDLFDPSGDMAWNETLDDPYLHRSREAVTGPESQDRRLRKNWFPSFQEDVAETFSVFDAWNTPAFDSTDSTVGPSSSMPRAQAQGSKGKGGPGKPKKEPPGKTKKRAWILGMDWPYLLGAPPWGPSGDVPTPSPDWFSEIDYANLFRKRIPPQPFEHYREPLYFGPTRLRVDWESPLSFPVRRRPSPPLFSWPLVRDEEEKVDEPLSWDVPFRPIFRLPIRPSAIRLESFINLQTAEVIYVDKWESPVFRLPPPRSRRPLSPFPFYPVDQPPQDEAITLDKWYARLSEPMRKGPQLVLPVGTLDPYPLPPTSIIDQLVWRDLGDILPVWPLGRPIPDTSTWTNTSFEDKVPADFIHLMSQLPVQPRQRPHIKDVHNLQAVGKDETPLVFWSAQSDTMRLPPWRPKLPIALFPFRLVVEQQEPEEITPDKYLSWPQPDFTHRALRAVTGPEAQSVYWTVLTAPWIRFQSLDPNPLADTPGVTYAYWFTPLSLPVKLFTQVERDNEEHLRLYYPLQRFPVDVQPEPCESPRRRVGRRTGSCGV